MGFLERLRGYLERVERAPEGLPVVDVDMAAHLRLFEQVVAAARSESLWVPGERSAAEQQHVQSEQAREVEQQIREARETLPAFTARVFEYITETLAPTAPQDELTRLVNVAICLWFRVDLGGDPDPPWALDAEVRRIAKQLHPRPPRAGMPDGWQAPPRYALEVRLVARRQPNRHLLTRNGAVFLELSGIDAVRWLLALECAQSLGPTDDWRLSPQLAAQLVAQPRRVIEVQELAEGSWRFSLATIRRLAGMKLLQYEDQDVRRGGTAFAYLVFDGARAALAELAEQRPTPFAVLADALLSDEAGQVLDRHRPSLQKAFHDSAAASAELHARMVVHEIRNALVPAQIAFTEIDRELAGTHPELSPQRRRVATGIQRGLAFARDMLRIATLATAQSSLFDATTAIRDSIAGLATELNGGLRFQPPARALSIVGPRMRFVFAITNLLRNAAQAVAGKGIVEVTVEERESSIVVCVDDNGPGVPVEHRRAIFEPGVALRSGGSGQGLALVWQVIVGEMRGSARCIASALGGARFEVEVPMKGATDQ